MDESTDESTEQSLEKKTAECLQLQKENKDLEEDKKDLELLLELQVSETEQQVSENEQQSSEIEQLKKKAAEAEAKRQSDAALSEKYKVPKMLYIALKEEDQCLDDLLCIIDILQLQFLKPTTVARDEATTEEMIRLEVPLDGFTLRHLLYAISSIPDLNDPRWTNFCKGWIDHYHLFVSEWLRGGRVSMVEAAKVVRRKATAVMRAPTEESSIASKLEYFHKTVAALADHMDKVTSGNTGEGGSKNGGNDEASKEDGGATKQGEEDDDDEVNLEDATRGGKILRAMGLNGSLGCPALVHLYNLMKIITRISHDGTTNENATTMTRSTSNSPAVLRLDAKNVTIEYHKDGVPDNQTSIANIIEKSFCTAESLEEAVDFIMVHSRSSATQSVLNQLNKPELKDVLSEMWDDVFDRDTAAPDKSGSTLRQNVLKFGFRPLLSHFVKPEILAEISSYRKYIDENDETLVTNVHKKEILVGETKRWLSMLSRISDKKMRKDLGHYFHHDKIGDLYGRCKKK